MKIVDLTPDQIRALEHEISDHLSRRGVDVDVEVSHVQDEENCMKAYYTYEHPHTGKEVHAPICFTAKIVDHTVQDFKVVKNESMSILKDLLQLNEAKNHLGENEYRTYSGWRAACKKKDPAVWFEGDKDIAQAMVGPKPYKHGETKAIGEWDGEKGSVYESISEGSDSSELLKKVKRLGKAGGLEDSDLTGMVAAKQVGNDIHVVCKDAYEEGQYIISIFHVSDDGKTGDWGGTPMSSHPSRKEAIAALNEEVQLLEGAGPLSRTIENWMEARRAYRLEGPTGVRNFTKLVNAIGYRSFEDFFEDNSGALEALVTWIGSQNVEEWKSGLMKDMGQ